MPQGAAYCPGCGRVMGPAPVPDKLGLLRENTAGAVAYLTFIPALIFLFIEPYRRNEFVRFHSIQCLGLWLAGLAIVAAIRLASIALFYIPTVGPLLTLLTSTLVGLAAFVLWIVLIVKALRCEDFRVPILGDFAARHSIFR